MPMVFVYGTLLSGEYNNRLLETSKMLGEAVAEGFSMFSLGSFPACVPAPELKKVIGEVWEVTPEVFSRLDRLEGYPNFYDRALVQTPFGEAWMYIQRPDDLRSSAVEIRSGSWRQYLAERG